MKKSTASKKKKKIRGYNTLPDINSPDPKYAQEMGQEPLSPQEIYDLGGWLKDNAVGLGETAVGAVLTATGAGAAVGAPLMVSGGASILGKALADKPKTTDYSKENIYPRTVGKQNMTPNVMQFRKGGVMIKKSKRGSLH